MNDRAKTKGRMAIYAMAGVYLLYQAYMIFKGLPRSEGTDKIIMIIAMLAFTVIGTVMIIGGVYKSSRLMKEDREAMRKAASCEREKKESGAGKESKALPVDAPEEKPEEDSEENSEKTSGQDV